MKIIGWVVGVAVAVGASVGLTSLLGLSENQEAFIAIVLGGTLSWTGMGLAGRV